MSQAAASGGRPVGVWMKSQGASGGTGHLADAGWAREEVRSSAASTMMAAWVLGTGVCAVGAMLDNRFDLALYGCLGCAIVTVPALRQGFSWVSPWSLVMLAVYIGTGVRGVAIAWLGLDDPDVQKLFLRGVDVRLYGGPAAIYLTGLGIMTVGYLAGSRGHRRCSAPAVSGPTSEKSYFYSFNRLFWPIVVACALVGCYAFVQYFAATGGSSGGNISAKRTTFRVDGGQYQGGHGQWRALNELSAIAFWLVVAKFAARRDRTSLAEKFLVVVLFANAALLPFYSSVRSQILYIVLTGLAVQVSIRGGLPARLVVRYGAVATALIVVTTFLRQQSEGVSGALGIKTAARSIVDALILNLNFSEVPKAVNIIRAVPDVLPYSHGATITNFAVAWVPRSVWPEKPIIDPGVPVGIAVYGTDGSSIPPGAVAELYWSFGLGGVLVGSLFIGWSLARLFRALSARRLGVAGILIYSTAVFDLGGNAVSGSIGYAVTAALLAGATMAVVLLIICQKSRVSDLAVDASAAEE